MVVVCSNFATFYYLFMANLHFCLALINHTNCGSWLLELSHYICFYLQSSFAFKKCMCMVTSLPPVLHYFSLFKVKSCNLLFGYGSINVDETLLTFSQYSRLSPLWPCIFWLLQLNVQKSFWMTAEFLVSIFCQAFLIASTSMT